MIYINENIKKLNKFNRHNTYVVADFDCTLTNHASASWKLLAESSLVDEMSKEKLKELYAKYKPIENNETLAKAQKEEPMLEWWNNNMDVLCAMEDPISEKAFYNIDMKDMRLRKDTYQLLRMLCDYQLPLIIISGGISNLIKMVLHREKAMLSNISVLSNEFLFENGYLVGMNENVIHSQNKDKVDLPRHIKEQVEQRENVILLGDQISDIDMAYLSQAKESLKIGILEDISKLDKYKKHFDIVISGQEESDPSYTGINKILSKTIFKR